MNRAEALRQTADRIVRIRLPHPVRVAIDGVDAAGKTTLADALAPLVAASGRGVIRASIDGFHHPRSVRYRRGKASAEGYYYDSFDLERLISDLLAPLGPGGNLRYRRAAFDFRADTPVEDKTRDAVPDQILLFDGVFLLRPELKDFWDLTIFVDTDFEIALERAKVRDRHRLGSEDEVLARYGQRYVPGQKLYLEESSPKTKAHLVIHNNDPNNPALVFSDHSAAGG